jgi:hypothetical protein
VAHLVDQRGPQPLVVVDHLFDSIFQRQLF